MSLVAAAVLCAAFGQAEQRHSSEPGPSWDPRPEWQRAKDGHWRSVMRRRPVQKEMPAEIVPIVENRPYRIPRAMSPIPQEVAPNVTPIPDAEPGKIVASACVKATNYNAPKSTAAEDRRFIAEMERVIDVLRRDPLLPPPGFEVKMGCSFERRTDTTGIYRGRISLLFYPYSDKNHYWHGGLEVLVNDLGVMGPRNNAEDRADDPKLDFPIPAPAVYRNYPYAPAEHGIWGGIYLSKRPDEIYKPITYREWVAENLPRLEAEYRRFKSIAETSPTVRNQVTRRNYQSMYERTLLTRERMPAAELDTPVWLADSAPSDAANPDAWQQVRLNVPGYFNPKLPAHTIQLINILPMHSKYNHLHALLEKLDFESLMNLMQ
jgi:hypothetical protein